MVIHTNKNGFSLIEILVVIAIISILASISTVALRSFYTSATLRSGTSEVFGALTNARSSTISAENDSVYGVHISSTTVTRFEGATYTFGNLGNLVYTFEGSIAATSSIIENGGDIIFSKLIGTPSATGTIYIYNKNGSGTSTILIYDSGLIEYE